MARSRSGPPKCLASGPSRTFVRDSLLPAQTWDFESRYFPILQTGSEVSEYRRLVYDRLRVTRALSPSRGRPACTAHLLGYCTQQGVKGGASGQIGRATAEGAIGICREDKSREDHWQRMSLTNGVGQETILRNPHPLSRTRAVGRSS